MSNLVRKSDILLETHCKKESGQKDLPTKRYTWSKLLVKTAYKIKFEKKQKTRPAHVEGVKAQGAFTYPFA